MIDNIIKTLANHGIELKAMEGGISYFAGMQNGYKAASDLNSFKSEEDAVQDVITRLNMRQTEWSGVGLEEVPAEEIKALVPMKEGPQGGYHVHIDDVWMRVRKD